jgi:RNA polymerase sigma-70 factor (ECF subfamily)
MAKPTRTEQAASQDRVVRVQGLFVQHTPQLRGFVQALLPAFVSVDDVIQETFLTVTQKALEFEPGTSFVAWIYTIARYKAAEVARRDAHMQRLLSDKVLDALCANRLESESGAAGYDECRLKALAECLESLAPHARRAVDLRYQQAHLPQAVAQILGCTAKSVYEALSRARALLRECVERKLAHRGA